MNGGLDFRDVLGGASASVTSDEALADGLKFEEMAAALPAGQVEKANALADLLFASLCRCCVANDLGVTGIMGLMIARLGDLYRQADAAQLPEVLEALRYSCTLVERGDY